MARALADDPRVLVLINPTAGVDVKSKESLLGAVEDDGRPGRRAVLIVSDELDDLRHLRPGPGDVPGSRSSQRWPARLAPTPSWSPAMEGIRH